MASYDSLGFSLSQLEEKSGEVSGYKTKYEEALEELKGHVASVAANWTGDESGVVAAFNTKFKAAEKSLDELKTLLTELDAKLAAKHAEFQTAATEAAALFQ